MITIRGNRAKSTGKCWKDTLKENVITTWQENVITTRIKGAKSVGTWRKPERLLGTNYDDAVNMLEKDSELQENAITTRGNGAKSIGN